ncbi:hypothetical protein DL98DRAFT_580168 [Cadophora sp. DSE1049]|nr:hypothetical protein DL98DRAFT_580168 [Cadophora sp. DSE1049]
MANYAWTAHVPIFGIDQGCTLECRLPAQIATGWFYDPFPALINHSCQPNAFYFCNGKEMVATAVEDIEAGTEVTYSYNYEPVQDYNSRRILLSEGFGFDCICKLCQKGDLGPHGELSMRVQAFIKDGSLATDIAEIEIIEELIEDMKTAGWYLESGHMYQLQKCAAKAYIATKSFRRFLKAYLTIFYGQDAPIVEVAQMNIRAKRQLKLAKDEALGATEPEETNIHAPEEIGSEKEDLLVVNTNRLLEWAGLPPRSREEIIGK